MMSLEQPNWPASFDELLQLSRSMTDDQREADRKRREAELAAQVAQRSRKSWIDYAKRVSDLGDRFSERTFENYQVPPGDSHALQITMASLDDLQRAVWLYGQFGCGKTHLGAAGVNALIEVGTPATFTTAGGLLDRIKASYDRNGNVREGEHDIITALVRIPYLFLDDLDKVVLTEWSAQKLYLLVNGRYEAKRGLGISSNLPPSDLRNSWSARFSRRDNGEGDLLPTLIGSIFDRLIEMTRIVRVAGTSQRGVA